VSDEFRIDVPPEVIAAGERVIAEVLAAKFPQFEVVPPGRKLPPGARRIPGAGPADLEAIRDRRELRARERRSDDDASDQ
jgi:hypothetical protein